MEKILKVTVLALILFTSPFTYGQGQGGVRGQDIGLAPDFIAEKVADIVVTLRGSMWLILRQDSQISPRDIFEEEQR